MNVAIMSWRYNELVNTVLGYKKTGVSLLAQNGNNLYQAGLSDDPGIYYFIPKIVTHFNLTINQGINLFFLLLVGASAIAGIFFLVYKEKVLLGKIISVVGIFAVSIFSLLMGDIYIASSSVAIGLIPVWLYFYKNNKKRIVFLSILSGLLIGVFHLIRSHSGTAVLIFISILIIFWDSLNYKAKITVLLLLFINFNIPQFYLNNVVNMRDSFLYSNNYFVERVEPKHPFWHSVYIGFGYLDNVYGIKYQDEIAIAKVNSVSPGTLFLSEEYEEILKNEVIKLIKTDFPFVINTIGRKVLKVLFFLVVFSNFGLFAAIKTPKGWVVETGFWLALAFSSLFGILVFPSVSYLLGFIAIATLYGMVSISYYLNRTSSTT